MFDPRNPDEKAAHDEQSRMQTTNVWETDNATVRKQLLIKGFDVRLKTSPILTDEQLRQRDRKLLDRQDSIQDKILQFWESLSPVWYLITTILGGVGGVLFFDDSDPVMPFGIGAVLGALLIPTLKVLTVSFFWPLVLSALAALIMKIAGVI